MKRTRALCLLLAAALLSAPVSAAPRNPGMLVHLATRGWFTLDPSAAYDAVSFIVTGNVYEPLITFKSLKDPDALVPFLAEKVPSRDNGLISKDGLTYRFPVRKGVRFHSGHVLTPEDVRYSILRFMLHDLRRGSALLLKPILGVYSTRDDTGRIVVSYRDAAKAVRVDGDAVVIRLKEPSSTFLKVLASLPIVVSKEWCVSHGEWNGKGATWRKYNNRRHSDSHLHTNMSGTGPFRLAKADAETGDLVLERHKDYWRKPAALESVLLRVVPSPAVRLMMLENGDADSSYFEDRDFHELKELKDVKLAEDPSFAALGEVLFFTFRTTPDSDGIGSGKLDGRGVPPDFFADRHVRRGFAHAIDYDRYFKRGMGFRGKRASGPFPDLLLPPRKSPAYAHDAAKAKKAFRKALGGRLWEKGFALTLTYSPSNSNRLMLAENLRDNLAKINPKFKLKVRTLPSKKLYSAAGRHELPLFIAGFYADYPDPASFAFGMLHSSGYFGRTQRYSNPRMDKLIEKAARGRKGLYRKIRKLALKDLPQIYTYQPARFRAGRSWVGGLDSDHNVSNLGLNNFPYFYVLSK